jgi:hypothetical protein
MSAAREVRQGCAALLAAAALAGCGAAQANSGEGTVLGVEALAEAHGLALFEPVAALSAADGSVYVLDRGNSRIFRFAPGGAVDTLAGPGAGPGELKSPAAFGWTRDSLLAVIDAGNARVQFLRRDGSPVRTFPYSMGAADAEFDPANERVLAVVWGQNFALEHTGPAMRDNALVAAVSLRDGGVLARLGAPRPYEGTTTPIVGNLVRIARDPASGDVWLAWLMEPYFERFDASGRRVATLRRELGFRPPAPREVRTPALPMPRVDYQQLAFGIEADSAGRLYVLAPVEARRGSPDASDYRPPAQAVDVLEADGTLRCRVRLPVTATALALGRPGEFLLADAATTAEVYRVRYRCPD